MLRFDGERYCSHNPAQVFALLTNPEFLLRCLPDVEAVRECSADSAVFTVRPALTFVRGNLDVTLTVVARQEPEARFRLLSKGIGASAEVESHLHVAAQEQGTLVRWQSEVKSLTGLLKLVPAGLIRGAAEKAINEGWDRVMARMNSELQQEGASSPA